MIKPEKTMAVVVGIEKYAAGRKWDLDGPASDAFRFVKWLRYRGVPKENILLFLSPLEANLYKIQMLDVPCRPIDLSTFTNEITGNLRNLNGDLLWFFWGGHGVVDKDKDRKLFYQNATETTLWNLNLNNLLETCQTDYFKSFSKQIWCIDTCANFIEDMSIEFSLPGVTFPAGDPAKNIDQYVMFAAKQGELALNQTAMKSGVFSNLLLTLLEQSDNEWPPDMAKINNELKRQFAQLRDKGKLDQTPVIFWYKDGQGDEETLGKVQRNSGMLRSQIHLTQDQLIEVVNAISKCRVFSDDQGRKAVLGNISKEIRQSLPLKPSPQDLVTASLRYNNGIEELMSIIRFFEFNSREYRSLEQLVGNIINSDKETKSNNETSAKQESNVGSEQGDNSNLRQSVDLGESQNNIDSNRGITKGREPQNPVPSHYPNGNKKGVAEKKYKFSNSFWIIVILCCIPILPFGAWTAYQMFQKGSPSGSGVEKTQTSTVQPNGSTNTGSTEQPTTIVLPPPPPPPVPTPKLEVFNTAQPTSEKGIYEGREHYIHAGAVFLIGPQEELNQVEKVVYFLHTSFNPYILEVTDGPQFFQGLLPMRSFELKAEIHYKNGKVETLKHYFNINNQLKLDVISNYNDISKTNEWTVFLRGDRKHLDQIRRVVYYLHDSRIADPFSSEVFDGPQNGFAMKKDTLGNVKIYADIYYKDDYKESIEKSFDFSQNGE